MNSFEKITALQDNEGFVKDLETIESTEELQELFHRHGIDVTVDELRDMAESAVEQNSSELSENDLADVTGGASFRQRLLETLRWLNRPKRPRWN